MPAAYNRTEETIAANKGDAYTEARTNAGQEVYLGAACMVEKKARERVPYTGNISNCLASISDNK